jgi:CxxC motif-containing protein
MREFICITCPTGCLLEADLTADGSLLLRGNGCKRGEVYARAELTNPVRSLTTTVRTAFPHCPTLPVRTDREIPQGKLREVMALLADVVIDTPLGMGETILELAPLCEGKLIATSNWLLESA